MLTPVVSALPAAAQPYAKAIVAAVLAVLQVLVHLSVTLPGWVPVVLAVLTAPAIYATPNLEPTPIDPGPLPDEGALPLDEV